MRRRMLIGGVLFVGATALMTSRLLSQDKEEPPGKDAMMEAWMKSAAPGEHHEHLKPLVGSWNHQTRWRMVPDAPWEESGGTSEFKWILGGRFLAQKVRSEMEGQVFEGLGLLGYDNLKKKHTSAWMDTFSTQIMTSLGTCEDSGKVTTMYGEYDDAMTGQRKKMRSVTRVISDDKFMLEMYDAGPDGKEFKSLEITYVRK